ncbi:hypothetical protein AKO1_000871, partial [Acrasis kona]
MANELGKQSLKPRPAFHSAEIEHLYKRINRIHTVKRKAKIMQFLEKHYSSRLMNDLKTECSILGIPFLSDNHRSWMDIRSRARSVERILLKQKDDLLRTLYSTHMEEMETMINNSMKQSWKSLKGWAPTFLPSEFLIDGEVCRDGQRIHEYIQTSFSKRYNPPDHLPPI